jgi:transcriptional regulator with XRE-family HTH domain
MGSTFADRLWWARHRAGLGATRLARAVGCSQSLISALERNNAEQSKLNNKFAQALGVDPAWLAHGLPDRAPGNFDEAQARRGREAQGQEPARVVRLPPAEVSAPWHVDHSDELTPSLDQMKRRMVDQFIEFLRAGGAGQAPQFIDKLRTLAELEP